ncbi:MBOAT family O-acyltransferase [Duganella levis]|uniref:Acyltransferase n=1 Tax=Duganella levis TaxID=2692169 RepID=A0ABW9W8N8_9BURK|nr:hypothetical protein [Duganella levis]
MTEFRQCWHTTLAHFVRDYGYIPLDGNRSSPWRTYRKLMVVFELGALWHGAAYTFLAWALATVCCGSAPAG